MKLGKDKEELAKEKMDLILQATNLERDVRRLNEVGLFFTCAGVQHILLLMF